MTTVPTAAPLPTQRNASADLNFPTANHLITTEDGVYRIDINAFDNADPTKSIVIDGFAQASVAIRGNDLRRYPGNQLLILMSAGAAGSFFPGCGFRCDFIG